MRAMGGRPVLMQRFPQGRRRPVVLPEAGARRARPSGCETTTVETVNGTPSRALVAADVGARRLGGQPGCLGFHVWPHRADDPEHADELRLDLDPQPGTGFAEVRAAALRAQGAARRARHRRLPEDHRQPRPARLRPPRSRAGTPTPSARPPWPRRASSSAAAPTSSPPPGGRRSAASASSSTTTRTRRTRRSSARGRCAPARARRSRTPLRWEELDDVRPRRADAGHRARPRSTRDGDPVGRRSTTARSRSSRCSRCTSATARTACSTRRGRRSTRSSPTSRRASPRAAPASPTDTAVDEFRAGPQSSGA